VFAAANAAASDVVVLYPEARQAEVVALLVSPVPIVKLPAVTPVATDIPATAVLPVGAGVAVDIGMSQPIKVMAWAG
jgi:hypothetical protein